MGSLRVWIAMMLVAILAACGGGSGDGSGADNNGAGAGITPQPSGESTAGTGGSSEGNDGGASEVNLEAPKYVFFRNASSEVMVGLNTETGDVLEWSNAKGARSVFAISDGLYVEQAASYTTGKEIYAVSSHSGERELVYATSDPDTEVFSETMVSPIGEPIYQIIEAKGEWGSREYKTLLVSKGAILKSYPSVVHNSPLVYGSKPWKQPDILVGYHDSYEGAIDYKGEVFDTNFVTIWKSLEAFIHDVSSVSPQGRLLLTLGYPKSDNQLGSTFKVYDVTVNDLKSGVIYTSSPVFVSESGGMTFFDGKNFCIKTGKTIYLYMSETKQTKEVYKSPDSEYLQMEGLFGDYWVFSQSMRDSDNGEDEIYIYNKNNGDVIAVGRMAANEGPGFSGGKVLVNGPGQRVAKVVDAKGHTLKVYENAFWVIGHNKDPLDYGAIERMPDSPAILVKINESASCDLCDPELWWADAGGEISHRIGRFEGEMSEKHFSWPISFAKSGDKLALMINGEIYLADLKVADSLRKIVSDYDVDYLVD